MKKTYFLCSLLAALLISCQQDQPADPEDFGYLTIGITVEVESEPASGRIAAVNTDNFKVTIFQADGTEYLVIDPFSSAPPEVQLPVGEYYVEATSNDLVEAAFDSPYYFARSDNFTIDKEELKTIDIEAKLANCKVAINFSSEVTSVFDAYSGQVEVVSSGTTLVYAQGETREGYFVVEPLAVEVYLSYTKLDGTTIDRTFNASIDNPQPATLYNINVDATLEDGQIVFNLTVDESVDTVNIDLGSDVVTPFASSYGGSLSDLALGGPLVLSDGNFLISGMTESSDGDLTTNNGSRDAWVFKIDPDGNIIWSTTYGSPGIEEIQDIQEDLNGNIIIAGNQSNASVFYDAHIAKVDASGILIWDYIFGGGNEDRVDAVVPLSDGGYLIGGSSYSQGPGSPDIWLFKLDTDGILQWEKTFGGFSLDFLGDMIPTSEGGFMIIGSTSSSDGDLGEDNADGNTWIIKLDASAEIEWEQTYGGTGSEQGVSILENGTGYIASSTTQSSELPGFQGDVDTWLFQIDFNGNMIWNRAFGTSLKDYCTANLNTSDDGGYLLGGYSTPLPGNGLDEGWLAKVDANGNEIWNKTFAGNHDDQITGVAAIPGGILMAAHSRSTDGDFPTNQGFWDVWVFVLDEQGNY
ncbi:DUF4493 domain-containing protein [Marinoscillum sp.]|uniref:DUF4493 domain-containing protein n=1 Tax=Marinoscillum sp. TaxID=2024838 RepID=UPI003BAB16CB